MGLLSTLVKSQRVISVSPDATIHEAVVKMADNKVGSVLVMKEGKIKGIFTERDLLLRVIAKRLNPAQTIVSEVMSTGVCTIPINETLKNCYEKMEKTKCRHLPITDGEKIVGMVTMRNILEWLVAEIEQENIQMLKYIQS